MRKYRIIIFVFFLFVFCMAFVYRNNTKELKLTKNMFGCDSPTLKGRVKFVINRTVYLPYVEKKLFIEERHPVAQYFIFYKIINSDKKTYWVCPEMRIFKNTQDKVKILFTQVLQFKFERKNEQ